VNNHSSSGEVFCSKRTLDWVRANPSEETIRLGPLAVRFLITAENSTGSIAAFEPVVPDAQRLPAPHSHDHYEETIYGIEGGLGLSSLSEYDRPSCFRTDRDQLPLIESKNTS
jgi:hypothetical protein